MKAFLNEFKEFAMKGNVLELAVGIIIGAAFTAIVDSLVNDIISPVIGLIVKVNFDKLAISIGEVSLNYGAFLMAIVNFIIVAFVLFCVIKAFNKANDLTKKPVEEAAPTTKVCPYCKSEIAIEATRCPHCTSEL